MRTRRPWWYDQDMLYPLAIVAAFAVAIALIVLFVPPGNDPPTGRCGPGTQHKIYHVGKSSHSWCLIPGHQPSYNDR